MASTTSIVPEEFEIAHDRQTGEVARLTFFQGETIFHVHLARNQLPMFLRLVQQETGILPPERLDPNALDLKGAIALRGRQVKPMDDGDVLLTLYLATDDGVRFAPLQMSKEDAAELGLKLLAAARAA